MRLKTKRQQGCEELPCRSLKKSIDSRINIQFFLAFEFWFVTHVTFRPQPSSDLRGNVVFTTNPKTGLRDTPRKPLTLPPPKVISTPDLVDEERLPWYSREKYYPAKPGDVIGDRFQILVKIGYGSASTTWMARDLRNTNSDGEVVAALKINLCEEFAEGELEIEKRIEEAGSAHHAHALLRTNHENFQVEGPHGKHLCLAYPPLGAPIWHFKARFENEVFPFPLVKLYLMTLLEALDCLHTDCAIVHTDLKLENILMPFEDEEVLAEFMNRHISEPAKYKLDANGKQVFYRSNAYGPLKDSWRGMIPRIVDFGSAMQLRGETGRGIFPIQPNQYRAPEVTLGFPWNRSADIWNLGTLIWDMAQGTNLFQQAQDSEGKPTAKAHLAEMIALLGMPSSKFIEESHSALMYQWPYKIRLNGGELSENAFEMFGGPFFDENGKFLHEDLIPDRRIEDTLSLVEEKDRNELLAFAKKMLTWDPEERATARQLLEDPFLKLE